MAGRQAACYSSMPACQLSGKHLRRHGDKVARLAGGYYRALGRVDDTMNLRGIKVGGGWCWKGIETVSSLNQVKALRAVCHALRCLSHAHVVLLMVGCCRPGHASSCLVC